jgi:hypothetical protein
VDASSEVTAERNDDDKEEEEEEEEDHHRDSSSVVSGAADEDYVEDEAVAADVAGGSSSSAKAIAVATSKPSVTPSSQVRLSHSQPATAAAAAVRHPSTVALPELSENEIISSAQNDNVFVFCVICDMDSNGEGAADVQCQVGAASISLSAASLATIAHSASPLVAELLKMNGSAEAAVGLLSILSERAALINWKERLPQIQVDQRFLLLDDDDDDSDQLHPFYLYMCVLAVGQLCLVVGQ